MMSQAFSKPIREKTSGLISAGGWFVALALILCSCSTRPTEKQTATRAPTLVGPVLNPSNKALDVHLSVGMTSGDVIASLGYPESRQYAGNKHYKNERWIYKQVVTTQNGFVTYTRNIYFEHGKVVGWRTTGGD